MMFFIIFITVLVVTVPIVISSSLLAKLLLGGKNIWLATENFNQDEIYSNDWVSL